MDAWLSRGRAGGHRRALKDAREIGQVATLMAALWTSWIIDLHCRNYAAASAYADELLVLADEKGALSWKAVDTVITVNQHFDELSCFE